MWLKGRGIETARQLAHAANISTQAATRIMHHGAEPKTKTLAALGLRKVYMPLAEKEGVK